MRSELDLERALAAAGDAISKDQGLRETTQESLGKLKPVIEKHGAAISATVAEMQAELAKVRK